MEALLALNTTRAFSHTKVFSFEFTETSERNLHVPDRFGLFPLLLSFDKTLYTIQNIILMCRFWAEFKDT